MPKYKSGFYDIIMQHCFTHGFYFAQNNINHLIDKRGFEVLNQCDEHEGEHCLKKGGGFLRSDCDEQVWYRKKCVNVLPK